MQKHEKLLFGLSAVCSSVKNQSVIYFSSSGSDFSLSLTLLYPVRNSLPFTSLRSVTIGSGRGFLEGGTCKGQAQGLLEPADPEPEEPGVVAHEDHITVEIQVGRGAAVP